MGGWPHVRLADTAGQLIATVPLGVRQNAPSQPAWTTVVLAPQGTASFDIYSEDFDALHNRPCPVTSAASVMAPGASSPLSVELRIPDCGAFEIAPVIAGPTDTEAWSVVVHRVAAPSIFE